MKTALLLTLLAALLLTATPATAGVYNCMINCYLYAEDTEQCVANCGLDKRVQPPLPFSCKHLCEDVFKWCAYSHMRCRDIFNKCMKDCDRETNKPGIPEK